MSPNKRVFTIGLAGYKGMTPEQMDSARQHMKAACSDAGIDFDSHFIQPEFSNEGRDALQESLRLFKPAVVMIGSGIRLPEENTRLLEDTVNLVLAAVMPAPKFAFATRPEEMMPTFRRLLAE